MVSTSFSDRITTGRIGHFLFANGKALEQSYMKISSGKNVQGPSDSVGDYFRSEQTSTNIKSYDTVSRSIDEMAEVLDYAESANRFIWDDVAEMQGLVKDYYAAGVSDETKATLESQFNQAKFRIQKTQEGAVWDGKDVLKDSSSTPLMSINTDPHNLSQKFSISFDSSKVVDVSVLDITAGETEATDAIEVQYGRTASFAAQLTGYKYGIYAQRKMAEVISKESEATLNSIQDIDEAKEIISMTKRSVQQQAALSMFAQAGMRQSSILKLVS